MFWQDPIHSKTDFGMHVFSSINVDLDWTCLKSCFTDSTMVNHIFVTSIWENKNCWVTFFHPHRNHHKQIRWLIGRPKHRFLDVRKPKQCQKTTLRIPKDPPMEGFEPVHPWKRHWMEGSGYTGALMFLRCQKKKAYTLKHLVKK